jgi:hypothetical protein
MNEFLFDLTTPLGFRVHTTLEYWNKLIIKHPEIEDKLQEVINTLENPAEIRKSKRDKLILLFYSVSGRYLLCVVSKRIKDDAFLVTAYITNKVKEGEVLWRK